jgi:hypothetical protein
MMGDFVRGDWDNGQHIKILVYAKQVASIRRLAPATRPSGRSVLAASLRVIDNILKIFPAYIMLRKMRYDFVSPLELEICHPRCSTHKYYYNLILGTEKVKATKHG